jgi:hypothetical protein
MRRGAGGIVAAAAVAAFGAVAGAPAQTPQAGGGATTYRVVRLPPSARIEVTGTFVIDVALRVNADLPEGTSLSFSGIATPADNSYLEQVDIYGVAAKVANHQASAKVTLPYAWLVVSTKEKVTVSVYVTGYHEGAASYSGNSSLSTTIDLPKNGATTTIKLEGAI